MKTLAEYEKEIDVERVKSGHLEHVNGLLLEVRLLIKKASYLRESERVRDYFGRLAEFIGNLEEAEASLSLWEDSEDFFWEPEENE